MAGIGDDEVHRGAWRAWLSPDVDRQSEWLGRKAALARPGPTKRDGCNTQTIVELTRAQANRIQGVSPNHALDGCDGESIGVHTPVQSFWSTGFLVEQPRRAGIVQTQSKLCTRIQRTPPPAE